MIFSSAGVRLNKGALPLVPVVDDPVFTVTQDLHIGIAYERVEGRPGLALFRRAGQTVRQSEIDRAYDDATVVTVTPARGFQAGGQLVTINGTNLDGVSAVRFGGVPATAVTVVNRTTVTCLTPAQPATGVVDVVVTDDSGTDTMLGAFTIVQDDATVTGSAPASGPAAGGTVVTVDGTYLTGATGITFGGSAGTAFAVVSPTQVRATTPARVAGLVDVVVLHPTGNETLRGAFTYV